MAAPVYPKTIKLLTGTIPNVGFGAYLGLSAYQAYKEKSLSPLGIPAATVGGLVAGEKWITPLINKGVKATGSKLLKRGIGSVNPWIMGAIGADIVKGLMDDVAGPVLDEWVKNRHRTPEKSSQELEKSGRKLFDSLEIDEDVKKRWERGDDIGTAINTAKLKFKLEKGRTPPEIDLDELTPAWSK